MNTPIHSEFLHEPNGENGEKIQRRLEFLEGMIGQKQAELTVFLPVVQKLLERRHANYDMPRTMFSGALPVSEQLYVDPTYNDTFIHGNHIVDESGVAKGGDLNARSAGESYDAEAYDDNEYTQEILAAAQELGFVLPELPGTPRAEIDQLIGIADSNLEAIDHPVQAVIVPTAKGISNPMRIRGAIRDIESGAITTNTLIIAACERPVDDAERAGMEARGLHYGTTEYGSAIAALADVSGIELDEHQSESFRLKDAPHLTEGRMIRTKVPIGNQDIDVIVVSAPFDAERVTGRDADGNVLKQNRASTQDNFLAALEFLPETEGDIVMESHDTWIKSQAEVADQFMGIRGKRMIAAGPHKLDRLKIVDGKIVLNEPGQVVDEIAKTYAFKVQTLRLLENERQKLREA
jgi:hypothetical protein